MAVKWIFSSNTFEVQTRGNFKKMLSLDEDHYGKLVEAALSDPYFVPLRDDYLPLHTAFTNIYSNWQGAEGTHGGSTASVETLLLQLKGPEIKAWEGVVRFVFPEDSPNEQSIFPNKRAPFQTGTYAQRISAVKTLAEKLATFTTQPLLVTLSGTVQSFYNTIEATRMAQTGDELGISSQSSLLEQQRQLCAEGMYGNLGKLMYKFRAYPVDIEQFWDMSLLRNIADTAFIETLTINPHSIATAGLTEEEREAVQADTPVVLRNSSTAAVNIKAGFSAAAGGAAPFTITLEPGEERTLSASELGWSSEKKFLTAENTFDETGTLEIEIDI